jgi:RNA polymerase sigma factor (TIGR02999 family)
MSPGMAATLSSLITSADDGDARAADALFALLYAELRRVARRELARNSTSATLSATTLLHEAYLQMAGQDEVVFPDRARFMAYASRVMRGLIIDYVRSRRALKRGGQFEITALNTDVVQATPDDRELTLISDALDELATTDAGLAQVVDLKFFCGFSLRDIAAMRGVSERTIQREWEKARIYLHRAVRSQHPLS